MNRPRSAMLQRVPDTMPRAAAILLVLAACDLPQQPEEPEEPTPLAPTSLRFWEIRKLTNDDQFNGLIESGSDQTPAPRLVSVELGPLDPALPVSAPDSIANAEVFWNETGETYWVGAQAPLNGLTAPENVLGSEVRFDQFWRFRKDLPNATFELVILDAFLEVYDGNGTGPSPDQCNWSWVDNQEVFICDILMRASLDVEYFARRDTMQFFSAHGVATIEGWGNTFARYGGAAAWADQRLLDTDDLVLDPPGPDVYQTMRLPSPITIDFPLDSVAVGEVFEIGTLVTAKVWNRRQGESYVGVYFRDPAATRGLSLEFEGLTMLDPPSERWEPSRAPPPAPACSETGSGGAGGTIQFDATGYRWAEWPGDEAPITVTRSGGSDGQANVAFATDGGTATPGSDYDELTVHVRFADGEEGTRIAYVPIIADTIVEPNETVSLTLSDPGGCATLGDMTNAELTIMDDDHPLPDLSHTIGGTVTGLEGSGLVLTNNSTDDLDITQNGAFVFDREYADGVIYNVRVDTQPSEPAQFCEVANGSGTVVGADVTNILVTCETLPPAGASLDPSFGDGGKVTNDVVGPAADIAVQTDGKIVVVGGDDRTGATLARFNPDGSPDQSFGSGGLVSVEFHGRADDELRAVAIQPDGRIVVAGETRDGVNSPTQEDFVIARYDADGTLDTSFGGGVGWVSTDFVGRGDGAYDVLIQTDGAILVAGIATVEVIHPDIGTGSFGVVRYTSAGELDTSFNGDGKVATDVAGATGEVRTARISFGYAAALQPDGKIVLTGRVAESGGDEPDIGVVRYNANGTLDMGFGGAGIVREKTDDLWDEAADVIVQPDGRIAVVGHTNRTSGIETTSTILLMRYNPDGSRDGGFGAGGQVEVGSGLGRSVALQPDGKLVAVGMTRPPDISIPANFLIARLHASGELDTVFGADGTIEVDFFGSWDEAQAVVIQVDGKIVAAGSSENGASTGLGMVRVLP